jgi:hypothetical protein
MTLSLVNRFGQKEFRSNISLLSFLISITLYLLNECMNFNCDLIVFKLLIYCIKNYKLKIKTLNLMNNPINFEFLTEIHRHIPNEYGLDTSALNGFKQTQSYEDLINAELAKDPSPNRRTSKSNIYDIHIRDQMNIEKFISNANMLNDQSLDEFSRTEYVKNLERDYNDLRQRYEKAIAANRLRESVTQKQANEEKQKQKHDDEFKKYQEEIMNPYDDLRYKTHNILPFNIKSY